MHDEITQDMSPAVRLWSVSWPLIVVTTLITAVGVTMLYSVAGGAFEPWAERHAIRYLIGLAIIFAAAALPLRFWLAAAYPAFALCIVLLIAVAIAGVEMGGAQRWLSLGGFVFQPGEFAKAGLVLALARYFQCVPSDRISHPLALLAPVAMIALPVLLVLDQPDLGTAGLIAVVGCSMMFIAGVSWLYFVAAAVASLSAAPFAWDLLHDYQRERILTFLEPERDPLGKGYQIFQSKIAIGSGGPSGKGFMNGTQSQLDFIPEKHTDFILTMFAEETGFAGTLFLLALYGVLFLLLVYMGLRCRSHFARLLVAGAWLTIFAHTFINAAMVAGLLPVVGVPLPLVSYGGTSLITTMFVLGLATNAFVHRRERFVRERLATFW